MHQSHFIVAFCHAAAVFMSSAQPPQTDLPLPASPGLTARADEAPRAVRPVRTPELATAIGNANRILRKGKQPDENAARQSFEGQYTVRARFVSLERPAEGPVVIQTELTVNRPVRVRMAEGDAAIVSRSKAVAAEQKKATDTLRGFESKWTRRTILVGGRPQVKYVHPGCQLRFPPMTEDAFDAHRSAIVRNGTNAIAAAKDALETERQSVRRERESVEKAAKTVRLAITVPAEHPGLDALKSADELKLLVSVTDIACSTDPSLVEGPATYVSTLRAALADPSTPIASAR